MSFRSSLHSYVRDQLDVAVHDSRLPVRPMMPSVVQRFISGRADQTHSAPVSLLEKRVQFDIYGNNDEQVDDLSLTLLHKLDGYHGPMGDVSIGWAGLLSDLDTKPEDIKGGEVRYRRIMDFAIAYQESRP
jgi:hypothetical protein